MAFIYQNQQKQILSDLIDKIKDKQNINQEIFLDYFVWFFNRKNNNFRKLIKIQSLDFLDFKYRQNFSDLIKIEELKFEEFQKLVFYACKLKDQINYRTSKKKQYELAKKILKLYNNDADAAIFIFYDNNFNCR